MMNSPRTIGVRRMPKFSIGCLIAILFSIAETISAQAAPLGPKNILVCAQRTIREYTARGQLIQVIPLDYGGRAYPVTASTQSPGDIVVDQFGWIDCFNGSSNPFLTRYSPGTGTFVHNTFPGWSRSNNGTGGLAAFQNFVFATDVTTYPGQEKGIVRFDVFNNTTARFATSTEYVDLNIGLDGKLYALRTNNLDIDVFEPATMQLLNHIAMPSSVNWIAKIAADQMGQLYVIGWLGKIYRLSSDGTPQASLSTGFTNLTDIDIDDEGRIIVAQPSGYVLLTDRSLGSFSLFFGSSRYEDQEIHVCFTHSVPMPVGPVQTPNPTPIPTAAPVPTHNILVTVGNSGISWSRRNSLREFTQDGVLLHSIRFNYGAGPYPGTESLRAITVDQDGNIYAFNGTFFPFVTRFSWQCSTFTHTTLPGWNIVNGQGLGGIAVNQYFVFVNDMTTAPPGQASGIVRFDLTYNIASRFYISTQFSWVKMGLDGNLYTGLDVYNPFSMQLIKHNTVPANLEGGKYAVDQTGTIFMTNSYGTIHRMDNNMVVQASAATGFSNLTDIDVDDTGRLVAVTNDGWVVVGDSSLNRFTSFRAIDDWSATGFFVSFSPLTPAPVELTSVVSRNLQETAGTFDIGLPVDGTRSVECRSGKPKDKYEMVFTFASPIRKVENACSSGAVIAEQKIDPSNGRRYIVTLTDITNATFVRVTMNGVTCFPGTSSEAVVQEMGFLLGDADGNGTVNSSDFYQVIQQIGHPVTAANFRSDMDLDGVITNADAKIVSDKLNTALPSYP